MLFKLQVSHIFFSLKGWLVCNIIEFIYLFIYWLACNITESTLLVEKLSQWRQFSKWTDD